MTEFADDSPRIGSIDIDRQALTAKGAPLALLIEPGVTGFDYGWVGSGTSPAAALEPQECTRVPVRIDPHVWSSLTPGECDLHPLLRPLNLHRTPPTITI